MPLKFWKKEKPPETVPAPESPEPPAPSPTEEPPVTPVGVESPSTDPESAPSGSEAVVILIDPDEAVRKVHEGLVELGLVARPTKDVFAKRVAGYPGGRDAFLDELDREPWKPTTKLLAGWLALRSRYDFDPEALLAEVNPRLSSFGLSIVIEGLAWLDQELNLRKAKLRLADREKVVRFKDPRDFLRGLNDLLAPKRLAFVELETWSENPAFLMVRDPKWPGLAETDVVVVKDPQTANFGECGECGARVGKHWNDCLSCGAVFG